jgi:hypothetical protein
VDTGVRRVDKVETIVEYYSLWGRLDMLLSGHFKSQSFPKTIDVPEMTKATYIQWMGGIFASMTKMEVRTQPRRRTAFKLAD